jgi:hypothetical protein
VRGLASANPMLDTRTYEIEFPDGRTDEYNANMIAENMYAQCAIDSRQYNLMEGIIDHKTDFMPLRLLICTSSMAATRK